MTLVTMMASFFLSVPKIEEEIHPGCIFEQLHQKDN